MSVVVISVGVIVGFVSYRDAFIPQTTSQAAVSTPIVRNLPASSPAPKLAPKPTPSTTQQPAPPLQSAAAAPKPEQKPAFQPRPAEETLPRLPKIQRLPESREAVFPTQTKPPNPVPQPTSSPAVSGPAQPTNIKPRKTRVRKTIEVPSLEDEKNT